MRSAWRSRRTCEDPSRGGGAAVIEVVVFDAYGTLFDIAAPARRAAAEPGRAALAAVWPQVARDWRLKQLQYSWIRAITGAHADFWQVTQDGLDWALEAADLAGEPGLRARLLALYRELDAYPEVPATLGRLAGAGARDRDPVERDAGDARRRGRERRASASCSTRVLSVEAAGVFKPAAAVYDLVGAEFGTRPDQVLFVSSNGWDAAAAAGYGFDTVWVNRGGGAGRPAALGARAASCPTSPVSRSSPPRHEPLHHRRRPLARLSRRGRRPAAPLPARPHAQRRRLRRARRRARRAPPADPADAARPGRLGPRPGLPQLQRPRRGARRRRPARPSRARARRRGRHLARRADRDDARGDGEAAARRRAPQRHRAGAGAGGAREHHELPRHRAAGEDLPRGGRGAPGADGRAVPGARRTRSGRASRGAGSTPGRTGSSSTTTPASATRSRRSRKDRAATSGRSSTRSRASPWRWSAARTRTSWPRRRSRRCGRAGPT